MFDVNSKAIEAFIIKIDRLVEDERSFEEMRIPKLEYLIQVNRLTDELIEREKTVVRQREEVLGALRRCEFRINRMIAVWDRTLELKMLAFDFFIY